MNDLREDVALANRIAEREGLVTAFGHVSARIPGTDTFLLPPRAAPGLATPESLLVLDIEGNLLEGVGVPNTEHWIHARIYAARPEVGAVAHVHAPACVVISQLGRRVQPLHNTGALPGKTPVYERAGLIRTKELGDAVAAQLGGAAAMLLRGHGANTVAPDVRTAIVLACLLEESARLQIDALAAAGGDAGRICFFDDEETRRLREELGEAAIARAWEYYSSR